MKLPSLVSTEEVFTIEKTFLYCLPELSIVIGEWLMALLTLLSADLSMIC